MTANDLISPMWNGVKTYSIPINYDYKDFINLKIILLTASKIFLVRH